MIWSKTDLRSFLDLNSCTNNTMVSKFLLCSGSRHYHIVNPNSSLRKLWKDSWYQDYSLCWLSPLLHVSALVRQSCRNSGNVWSQVCPTGNRWLRSETLGLMPLLQFFFFFTRQCCSVLVVDGGGFRRLWDPNCSTPGIVSLLRTLTY